MSTIDLNELLPALKLLDKTRSVSNSFEVKAVISLFFGLIGYDTQEQSDEKVVGYEFWGNVHGQPPEKIPGGPFYLRGKAQEPEADKPYRPFSEVFGLTDNKGGGDE